MNLTEKDFEQELINDLIFEGWNNKSDSEFYREDLTEVIDWKLLKEKLILINKINDDLVEKAILEIKKINESSLEISNEKAWTFLNEGIKVFDPESGLTKSIFIISKNKNDNQYDAIRQFRISNKIKERIPDIVLFINGIPVVVMELKASLATESIFDAYNQNESLKTFCPYLWTFNIMNFVSNRITSCYGSTFASFEHMHSIKNMVTRDNKNLITFLFSFDNLFSFLTTFSYFSIDKNKLVKYMAAPHQIEAVNRTIDKLIVNNSNKGGVIWHTQGSGKSVTMLILAKEIISNFPTSTILVVTDRNDLENQLFTRFSNSEKYLRNKIDKIESRKDLITKLNDKKHYGLFFSTIQKFGNESGILTNRDDIFIIVDEAHRSQNNITSEFVKDDKQEKIIEKFGFAAYMRNAFPNACLIGFTGTPLMKVDSKTTDIFGDYNHKYLMNDSVEDGTTVPINYEMRKVKINLNEEYLKELDNIQKEYIKTLDLTDLSSQQKLDDLLKSVNIKYILENEDVILEKTRDILKHLDKRKTILHGKAMIVATSRNAAYRYYLAIKKLKPEMMDQVILVMTDSNKDSFEMANAIVPKNKRTEIAEEFRKDNSKYKIAIVVNMWLTGFDVPDLDTMYVDKFLKWHNLMQAIARVNRIYEDGKLVKANGLIVDYIGIWKYLADALNQYTIKNSPEFDFLIEDIQKAKEKLIEKIDIINDRYLLDIYSYYDLDENEKYKFVIKNYEHLLNLDSKERNEFILDARENKRLYKASYSVLNKKEMVAAKAIEILNSLLSTNTIANDDRLNDTKSLIEKAIQNSIDSNTSDVFVTEGKLSKDINKVSEILEEESENIKEIAPRVAIEMIKSSINGRIKSMESVRPYSAKKLSDKLRDILNELQKTDDVEFIIDKLRELGKEAVDIDNQGLEFDNDPQLQAFYEVLADDDKFFKNKNSEILRRLAEEIFDEVCKVGVSQFGSNPRVKSEIRKQLKILLKQKYNYPPKYLGEVSGILIDTITKQIEINKEYFRPKEK